MSSESTMAFTSEPCQFGSECIQAVYDRFELFRKTKAFDPDDSKVPLQKYSYYGRDGEKTLAVQINGVYLVEYYKFDNESRLVTKSGQYCVSGGTVLNYAREENGKFSFHDWSKHKKFESSLQSIDAELPSDFEEDYKKVLVDLNAMRMKMFDYQKSLSNEDLERVKIYDFHPHSSGDGFYAQYIENNGGSLFVSKKSDNNAPSGRFSCDHKNQKYKIVDGKVIVDGEPFVPRTECCL